MADNLLEASTITAQDLTSLGDTPGTIAFMSPEQVQGEELDPRTDLFSFGVVIYEMATGHLPFDRKTVGATFAAILHEPPEPATRWNSQLPVKLDEIISKALQKDRHLRYQHASEIRSDLQQLKDVIKSVPETPAADSKSIATPPRKSAPSQKSRTKACTSGWRHRAGFAGSDHPWSWSVAPTYVSSIQTHRKGCSRARRLRELHGRSCFR